MTATSCAPACRTPRFRQQPNLNPDFIFVGAGTAEHPGPFERVLFLTKKDVTPAPTAASASASAAATLVRTRVLRARVLDAEVEYAFACNAFPSSDVLFELPGADPVSLVYKFCARFRMEGRGNRTTGRAMVTSGFMNGTAAVILVQPGVVYAAVPQAFANPPRASQDPGLRSPGDGDRRGYHRHAQRHREHARCGATGPKLPLSNFWVAYDRDSEPTRTYPLTASGFQPIFPWSYSFVTSLLPGRFAAQFGGSAFPNVTTGEPLTLPPAPPGSLNVVIFGAIPTNATTADAWTCTWTFRRTGRPASTHMRARARGHDL